MGKILYKMKYNLECSHHEAWMLTFKLYLSLVDAYKITFSFQKLEHILYKIHTDLFFQNEGHSRPLCGNFCLFNTVDSKQVNKYSLLILTMTGFERRTDGIESDRSTN